MDLSGLVQYPVASSCEHEKESSGFIKSKVFLIKLIVAQMV